MNFAPQQSSSLPEERGEKYKFEPRAGPRNLSNSHYFGQKFDISKEKMGSSSVEDWRGQFLLGILLSFLWLTRLPLKFPQAREDDELYELTSRGGSMAVVTERSRKF